MSSDLKPIKLYGSGSTNPPKVAMILEELSLPYEVVPIQFSDVKKQPYTDVNPNGRLPAITDPNTGITIWESGAILEYLVETYDTKHVISFKPGTAEYWHAKQWLFFQTTGQAPYYGQAAWFKKFHHEQVPSALDRYVNEVNRVTGILDRWLEKQKKENPSTDGPWLVGKRISYADIAFVQWQRVIRMFFQGDGYDVKQYPLVDEWLEKMLARDNVKRGLERCPQLAH